MYFHASSAGKAILAHLPAAYADELIDQHGLPELTEHTITDRDELHEELAKIREEKIAYNRAEHRPDIEAIGTPVSGPEGDVLGAISVTRPQRRMQKNYEDYVPEMLLDISEEITLRLRYPDRDS